jgi:hypothetical protein
MLIALGWKGKAIERIQIFSPNNSRSQHIWHNVSAETPLYAMRTQAKRQPRSSTFFARLGI